MVSTMVSKWCEMDFRKTHPSTLIRNSQEQSEQLPFAEMKTFPFWSYQESIALDICSILSQGAQKQMELVGLS